MTTSLFDVRKGAIANRPPILRNSLLLRVITEAAPLVFVIILRGIGIKKRANFRQIRMTNL
jgi:hypothetical protein